MDLTKQARRTILICAALSAATLAVYWPVTASQFVTYDDPVYVTLNRHVVGGLSWTNILWAFEPGFAANWHPATWVSHMLDVQIFGLSPGWHHLVNLVLHVANSVLLFLLLQRLTGAPWRSAFVAALFALHPLHVESVAWVSERKDVLSAFFFMLTLWAYARYAELHSPQSTVHGPQFTPLAPSEAPRFTFHASGFYLLSLGCFALGLMSKPMLVTVPFVLLLLDYWPLKRMRSAECGMENAQQPDPGPRNTQHASRFTFHVSRILLPGLLWEKAPFFLLTALSCVITVRAQSWGGAVLPITALPLAQRLGDALLGYAIYLRQVFWPAGLAVFYPLSSPLPPEGILAAVVVLLGITGWAFAPSLAQGRARASAPGTGQTDRPWRIVGWLWFVGMLVPVIGLVQVGMQQTADRYTYLPLVGLSIMLVWEVCDRLSQPLILGGAGGLVLLVCAALTWMQASYWHDSERLFRHALAVTERNWLAHLSLGHALLEQGDEDGAISEYQAAVAIQPLPEIRFILGEKLSKRQRYEEAITQFSEMLRSHPHDAQVLVELGIARARQGNSTDAVQALDEALRLEPGNAAAHNALGNVLAQQGRPEEAVKQFEEAVRLQPDNAAAHNNLAISCRKLGRMDEAIAHYRAALRLEPNSLQALNNLAWTLATCPNAKYRSGAEAVQLATKACDLTRYQSPIPLASLAAAYAAMGKFEEAVSFSERAQDLVKGGQAGPAAQLSAMLEAYRAGRPYYPE